MIKIKVKGQLLFFNLKDPEREKGLRDAWYAMSDMPNYLNKHINIITDKNEHFSYTVGEIEDCQYIIGVYTEIKKDKKSTPESEYDKLERLFNGTSETKTEIEKENLMESIFNKSSETEVEKEELMEELLDEYYPVTSEISKLVREVIKKIFSDLPQKTIKKFFEFTSKVMRLGYYIPPNDTEVASIIEDILRGPDDEDVNKYVERYIEYCKKRKLC